MFKKQTIITMKTLQTGYISGVNLARIVGAIGIILFHFGCHSDYLSPFLCGSANDNWGRIWVALFLAISVVHERIMSSCDKRKQAH